MDTPTGERWFYRYDPFGRRTGKHCGQKAEDIRYLWDGNQIWRREDETKHFCRHGRNRSHRASL
ncbi:hypothetical protein H5A43_18430 [Pectobacterium brasiliense]|nr:hypothetical protein [Pectobacterium brasiliense]